ncbi:MAG: energy-coupling factor transporter transmembrane protein EcfT [Chloroflexota bacterium]|nr:energy-coupling factor transporter transmembrane protein EcfT [Chloroflexota bacterium]
MDAVIVGGIAGPLALVVVAVVVPALVARALGRTARTTLMLSLPLAISVVLVNVLFFPGGAHVLLELGPLRATAEGVSFALEVLVRLLAIAGSVTLFYLTTSPGALVVDLERRGASPRVGFVALASIETVPATVERARSITAAQRARGLDSEGSVWRRARGLLPIIAPVILGSLTEVDERTLALEARAFGRPGRRTLLWTPADSSVEAAVRWGLVATVPLLVALRVAGAM